MSLKNHILIDMEGKKIHAGAREPDVPGLHFNACALAGCCSTNISVDKITIPISQAKKYTSIAQTYNFTGLDSLFGRTTAKEIVAACQRNYWGSQYTYEIFTTTKECEAFIVENTPPAATSEAQILINAMPTIKQRVGVHVGYGHVFYMAWNNTGDQNTLPPEQVDGILMALEQEGYKVTIHTTELSNTLYKAHGRNPDGVKANVVKQITIVYTGEKPKAVDPVEVEVKPVVKRAKKVVFA